jgi:hypothetical protein
MEKTKPYVNQEKEKTTILQPFTFTYCRLCTISNLVYEQPTYLSHSISHDKSPKEIEYSRSYPFFDPSQSSPPNDFLLKLERRLQNYQKTS